MAEYPRERNQEMHILRNGSELEWQLYETGGSSEDMQAESQIERNQEGKM